ncbi:MAG: ATP synthase F0 subunit B [Proteobacteria bacterium]|nr:ATP synthase F0 subunit B [Pseudomonadota bacterium]
MIAGFDTLQLAAGLFILFNLLCCIFPLTVAYASGGGAEGGDEGPGWVKFAWKLSNLLIIAGVIYWLTAKKVKEFFTGRQEGIKTSLAEAVTAREDAEKKFREYAAKLDQATGEIDEITRMIQAQGLTEKERIIGEALKAAEKMKEETQARMEQEFNKSSHQLRIEAVRLSAQMAEGLLRQNIRVEDHEAMVQDYIEKVVRKN